MNIEFVKKISFKDKNVLKVLYIIDKVLLRNNGYKLDLTEFDKHKVWFISPNIFYILVFESCWTKFFCSKCNLTRKNYFLPTFNWAKGYIFGLQKFNNFLSSLTYVTLSLNHFIATEKKIESLYFLEAKKVDMTLLWNISVEKDRRVPKIRWFLLF